MNFKEFDGKYPRKITLVSALHFHPSCYSQHLCAGALGKSQAGIESISPDPFRKLHRFRTRGCPSMVAMDIEENPRTLERIVQSDRRFASSIQFSNSIY